MTGCHIFGRLSDVGKMHELSPIDGTDYPKVALPMPPPIRYPNSLNSLWQPGSQAFFKDQRASQVGDILTILVTISDAARMSNQTQTSRSLNTDTMRINALGGFENYITKVLPGGANPANLFDVTSATSNTGAGAINRNETITITMAGIVTQLMPNGNMVVNGSQEVRVNNEMRLLALSGVIRRADILANNTISSDKIAELRLAYGGRGALNDVQNQRYGQQILNVIAPF
ncbi:MAG: flagellar basal body L-ring protein FlgH [Alphaproteobacteria bacterium]|nr:flagellar basal body L-ring protein FlgH [Alphaproteobacteria bacterium]